jgi:hypothetical protein
MAVTLRCAERAEVPAVLGLWAASDAEPTHTDDLEAEVLFQEIGNLAGRAERWSAQHDASGHVESR